MPDDTGPVDNPEYISAVDNDAFARARTDGPLDGSTQLLVAAERGYIERRRAHYGFAAQPERRHAALALSGGGIRSAAFALGVMQRLAKDDYLRLFDYLSTVSGGGYIGCSLTWLTSGTFRTASGLDFGLRKGDAQSEPFPYGSDDPQQPVRRHPPKDTDRFLGFLRSHGEYLIPGNGITLLSGIAVVLRGILLNLLVWFPIAVALSVLAALPFPIAATSWLKFGRAEVPPGFGLALWAGVVCWSVFTAASIVYSFRSYADRSPASKRYRSRRWFEKYARPVLLLAAGFTVVGTLPFVYQLISQWIAQTGLAMLVSGAAGGIWSFFKSRTGNGSGDKGGLSLDILAPVSGVLFCYGFLLLAYYAGVQVVSTGEAWGWLAPLIILAAMAVFSALLGWFTNLNYLTLHRFYRDRLMEAFMPDVEHVKENSSGPAFNAEPVRLAEMCDIQKPRGPYHIINCHLILTGTTDKTRKARGGDSFILSPFYCGSNATGWRRTEDFYDNEITLPTAMAISGAAANPNAGSGGTGITRNPIVSIVMSLFNVRLGYWVPNPNPKKTRQNIKPNHFNPGVLDLIDYQRDESSSILRLSDGGHFDNLGLYELIRRRVEFIVCCDAGADPDYAFSDLTTAIVRAEQDFGAVIKFDEPPLKSLMPSETFDFPRRAPFSRRAHARAEITYADGSKGTLIYLTTLIIKDLRLRMLGYLGDRPAFPDETTADQFFDEGQFEAYRELGFVIADRMLADRGNPASAREPDARGFAEEFTKRLQSAPVMARAAG